MVHTSSVLETILPVIIAIIALIPLYILTATYRRVGSRRVLLAAFAFAFFVIKGVLLFAVSFTDTLTDTLFELIEFASDLIIVSLFAASFLVKSAKPGLDNDGE